MAQGSSRGGVLRLFFAFQSPGYRWLWGNTLFTAGAWSLERLALGWLVLQLTDSPLWVGVAVGIQGVSTILCSVPAGVVADRVERRRLLGIIQALPALGALALGLLSLSGRIALWHLLTAASLYGAVMAFHWPTRNALIYDLVGRQRLLNATAASFMAMNLMRILTPAVGGALIARAGAGAAYFLILANYLVALALLGMVRVEGRTSRVSLSFLANLREGLAYLLSSRTVRSLLTVALGAEVFGYSYYSMLPVMARDVLQVGAEGLGYLTAAAGLGALAANLVVASLGDFQAKGWLLIGATVGFGLFLALFAFSPWFPLSLVLLALAGGMGVTYDTALATVLQTTVPEPMRGRVMGLMVLTYGTSSLGGFQAGAIAAFLGAPVAIGLGGLLVALNALRLAHLAPRLGR